MNLLKKFVQKGWHNLLLDAVSEPDPQLDAGWRAVYGIAPLFMLPQALRQT